MGGYSEVLQTIGAMVIFSMILMSANGMITRNTLMQVEGELEQEVVAVAQDIIEEGHTKEFDEQSQGAAPPVNIPSDFTEPSNLGPDSEGSRQDFDDFDDYNGWENTIETSHGQFNIRVEVFYVDPNTFEKTNYETTFKKMQVFITNDFLNKGDTDNPTEYKLEFIRNYYAD